MNIYLVGGAIRDELLGLPVKERDWVVVGASPEELIALGFQPVGKEFPVFLHPRTHEEYALARTERKIGKGYKRFTFYAAKDVTLAEDLKRRDLTINAMARSEGGELIDPFDGQNDLKQRILRHVSPAFVEDPVRILRMARFAAKLPDFMIAEETNDLMKQMVKNGEVDALVPERVWQEFERALAEKKPERFFEVLYQCSALSVLFPEIDIDGLGIKALIIATQLSKSLPIRFSALLHNIPADSVKKLCQRLRTPREYSDLAFLVARGFGTYKNDLMKGGAITLLNLLKSVDAVRRPKRFKQFLMACRAALIASQCSDIESRENLLNQSYEAIHKMNIQELLDQKLNGRELAEKIQQQQLEVISKIVESAQ